jgi:2-isopropylmalate synthase
VDARDVDAGPFARDAARAGPEQKAMSERLLIFDTTLRDGEQSPGCTLNRGQKLRIAETLQALGVDIIEAGYPNASEDDFNAVQAIARGMREVQVCALARCFEADITAAAAALADAARPRIHVFIAASPIHRELKLRMSAEQVIERAIAGVRQARAACEDVEFSAEDATRAEPEFLIRLFSAAIAAGARTINVPDTVGFTTPGEYGELIRLLRREVVGIDRVVVSTHCHDDLGLAVANSLAAVEAGARQVECTLTGIGERAGNAALEEVVMALRTRPDRYPVQTGIRTQRLYGGARQLASFIGQGIARNKAIVGENAFAHESGIHQHGMIADRSTYEIMKPEDVGVPGSSLVLGKHSGRAAVIDRLKTLGYRCEDAEVEALMTRYKRLADRKKEVFDADLEALWLGVDPGTDQPWTLEALQVSTSIGSRNEPTASIVLSDRDGRLHREAAIGDGPVDAIAQALMRATGLRFEVDDYALQSVTSGGDAQGRASVRVQFDGREYRGQALSTDVIEASANALLDAVNRITAVHAARERQPASTGIHP